jgi:hypothetical protein
MSRLPHYLALTFIVVIFGEEKSAKILNWLFSVFISGIGSNRQISQNLTKTGNNTHK